MARYTVMAIRNDTETVTYQKTVEVPDDPSEWASNVEDEGWVTPAEYAVFLAAPEICPFDCDHCRN